MYSSLDCLTLPPQSSVHFYSISYSGLSRLCKELQDPKLFSQAVHKLKIWAGMRRTEKLVVIMEITFEGGVFFWGGGYAWSQKGHIRTFLLAKFYLCLREQNNAESDILCGWQEVTFIALDVGPSMHHVLEDVGRALRGLAANKVLLQFPNYSAFHHQDSVFVVQKRIQSTHLIDV